MTDWNMQSECDRRRNVGVPRRSWSDDKAIDEGSYRDSAYKVEEYSERHRGKVLINKATWEICWGGLLIVSRLKYFNSSLRRNARFCWIKPRSSNWLCQKGTCKARTSKENTHEDLD